MICNVTPSGRRKLFWATQPESCGTKDFCDTTCGDPGLEATATEEGSSISTENWLKGLIINMLMTNAREPDTPCGYRPGSQGGHWSESYIASGPASVGTLIRSIPTQGRVTELQGLLSAYVQATLQRLKDREVARDVEVTVSYAGSNKFNVDVVVSGISNDTARVGLSGSRLDNGWIWSA